MLVVPVLPLYAALAVIFREELARGRKHLNHVLFGGAVFVFINTVYLNLYSAVYAKISISMSLMLQSTRRSLNVNYIAAVLFLDLCLAAACILLRRINVKIQLPPPPPFCKKKIFYLQQIFLYFFPSS
jgi:hypothetical protein